MRGGELYFLILLLGCVVLVHLLFAREAINLHGLAKTSLTGF